MHKSDEYGTILLKQKDKQKSCTCLNFAYKFARLLPVSVDDLDKAITELVDENVLHIDGDKLVQRRMVKDNSISETRSKAGKIGGDNTQKFAKAKVKANSEYDNAIDNVSKEYVIPTMNDVKDYFQSKGYKTSAAKTAFNYYDALNWHDKDGNRVKSWKGKMVSVWFKDENIDPQLTDSGMPKLAQ